eukprot:TRINITY_DN40091_c0_g1_i1.p1 TRINITY_DN40091_c0_g1~~TRINITY_DN40091_c0_g1_i1.p1  ORF type:complete len:692 (+),score=139.46 TRINITY_DN40091_c0_g1_i1:128-2077(+)
MASVKRARTGDAAESSRMTKDTRRFRTLQWNVFEDGLTDAPGSVGFSPEFDRRFNALLAELSKDDACGQFYGFGLTRDFSQLPPVTAINSSAAFLGLIDVLYNSVYHTLGGETRLGSPSPGKELGNCLRSLFLKTTLADPTRPPSKDNPWQLTDFEHELEKMAGRPDSRSADLDSWAGQVSGIRDSVFRPECGELVWQRSTLEGMWKRHNNCFRDKVNVDLAVFLRPHHGADNALAMALHSFCPRREADREGSPLSSIADAILDENGDIMKLRTRTFQSAMWWILHRLCSRSMDSVAAAQALATFAGLEGSSGVPTDADGRTALVFAPLLKEVRRWFEQAALQVRHGVVCKHLAEMQPDIVTLIEYNGPWRKMPLPAARNYSIVSGLGQASILFDGDVFEHLTDVDGVTVPVAARSDKERGVGDDPYAPKSSCMLLLKHKSTSTLVLAGAFHLESSPPSDSKKVLQRRAQVKAFLAEVSLAAESLASAGHRCLFVFGGDFNALREEFVHGTGDAFFASPGVQSVIPKLAQPKVAVDAPEPSFARLAEDGSLRLFCKGVDGGELFEASRAADGADGEVLCTRAGKSMVIDFLFVGSTGFAGVDTSPVRLVSPEEARLAADAEYGIHSTVMQFGSDHLPVACDVHIPESLR